MCGINGCIDKTEQRDLVKTLEEMNRKIRHRGPDDAGVWTENNLGMGMQRLSIIDLMTGCQPMHNPHNNTTIVFNGEIYNYQSLKKDMEASGQQFETSGDTEVILKLYQVHGTNAFGMLDGMFAFSLFDPDQKKVYCVRDFFGEKPLYYFSDDQTIGWASELKSLMLLKDQKPSIDSTALSLYFRLTYIPAPYTIYSGIYKLEPNQYLAIDIENFDIEKHPIAQNIKTQKVETKEQAIRYTHDTVMESVGSRRVADVPLASFLSGGVDSSVISLCLSQWQTQPIDTFSIGFENPLFDESKNAAMVSKTIGSKHHNFICRVKDVFSISEKVILNFDEPYADSSALASHWIAHHTSQSFKVALTGDGGDEVFGGYNKYLIGKIAQRYQQWVPRPLHQFNRIIFDYFVKQRSDQRGSKYKIKKLLNALDDPQNSYLNIISLGLFDKEYRQLIRPEWQQKDVFHHFRDLMPQTPQTLNDFRKIDGILSLDGDLMTKVDRTGMLSSLECRAPFLNKSLWQFSSSIPQGWHIHKGEKKHLLKSAFKSYFPDHFFDQPKKGFNVPVGDWLRTVYKKELLQFSEADRLRKQGIFSAEMIQKWVKAHIERKQDRSFQLWTFFSFQLWYFNIYQPL